MGACPNSFLRFGAHSWTEPAPASEFQAVCVQERLIREQILQWPPGGHLPVLNRARHLLEGWSQSDQTGLAWLHGRDVPPALSLYGRLVRERVINEDDAFSMATSLDNVGLEAVTGLRGCIGALAALAYHREWDEAVKVGLLEH